MTVTLNVQAVRRETEAAIQVFVDHRLYWLPKRFLDPPLSAGQRNVQTRIPAWLWEKKQEEP